MSDIDQAVITPLENLLVRLPMGGTPLGRMILGGVAGGAVAYYARPSVSFNPDGSAKPFILMEPDNPDAAVFPWWGFIVLPSVTLGLFI